MKIESSKNNLFKKLLSLTSSKGIRQEKQCLVSGDKITQEISQLSYASFWIFSEKQSNPDPNNQKNIELSNELFKELDVCGTHRPLLCVDYSEPKNFSDLDLNKAVLYVALSDPTNLGALIRTGAAFAWPQIVLLKEAAHPFLPKAIRAASGTCFASQFFKGPSIKDLVNPEILALDMNGQKIGPQFIKKDLKLLVGEEGQGIPTNFPGQKVQIPISNRVESLNATIASSLMIYEWSKI